ncbi:MAG: VOC family protein [Bacteroidetes bacterium]|nr:VOC family protein [Bacteroidota bacterium]MBL7103508.1 VOC family protein [Bacteroidales bacterium]
MKFEHIALSVSDHQEIERFYTNVLGMKQIKNFVLRKGLAANIFGINKEINVFLLQKDSVVFEIFVTTGYRKQTFDHVCISIKNREEFINKAMLNGYKVIRIKREIFDLIFIKDKYGNIFEIKEM